MAKPHAVAIPLSAQGHLNPLMRFCKTLAAQGFTITFVNIDPVHFRIAQLSNLDHAAAAPPPPPPPPDQAKLLDIRRAHVPIDGLDLHNDFRLSLQHFFEAQNSIVPHLHRLLLRLQRQGSPATCLISDVTMTAPTQQVADAFNIPRVVLYPSSPSFLLFATHLLQGNIPLNQVVDVVMSKERASGDIFWDGLAGLPIIHNNNLPHFKHVVDDTVYMYDFMVQALQECFSRAHSIIVNSFDELEAPAFRALSNCLKVPVYGVGPLVEPLHQETTTSLWKEDEACLLWLDQQPALSVLYVSFGSITLLTQPQFQEILAALLSSQQRFLWVFRPDLVENAPYTAFPSDFLSKTNGRGFVVDWSPQLLVLSHPAIGGFLTHCGWNSTIEAISHGVPMLCWPYFADQFIDAKYVVEEWNIGLNFKTNKENDGLVDRGEVERVIKLLMEGEDGKVLRKNVMRLKEAGYQSLLPGGTSYKSIQSLIQSLKA